MTKSPRIQDAEARIERSIAGAAHVTASTLAGPLLTPWKGHLAAAITLNALHGIAVTAQNLTPKWLISDILLKEAMTWREKMIRLIVLALGYMVVAIFGRMLMWHAGYRFFTYVRERAVFTLRSFFFRHVNHLCLRFHGRHPSGELFNYLFGSPLAQVMQFYQHSSMSVPGAIFTIVSTILLLGFWDPVLTGVLVVTAAGNLFIMQHARRRIRQLNLDYQSVEGDVAGHAADLLRGSHAVKLYAMEQFVAGQFEREAMRMGEKSYRRDVNSHIQHMKQESVTYIAYGFLLVVAGWRYLGGHADPGVIAAYLNAFGGIMGPMTALFMSVSLLGGAQASLERIGRVLKTASTTPDPDTEQQNEAPPGGDIRFEGVTFRYEERRDPVLRDFTLRIPQGQKIALVGPSGAGKSTVVQLLMRLYDPQEGRVEIGGTDLRTCRGTDLRHHIGIVPQDPFIFRTTIRDNIRVARPEATDDEIMRACERACAWEFIERMPGKLDEIVGEGGFTLSGGQRQRLAIARVLLASPAILVFDEATSALDTTSEHLIQASLEKECASRTAIFIAHRLATVKNCDRILVIDGGRIVQDGTYADLMSATGRFREMVQSQQLRL